MPGSPSHASHPRELRDPLMTETRWSGLRHPTSEPWPCAPDTAASCSPHTSFLSPQHPSRMGKSSGLEISRPDLASASALSVSSALPRSQGFSKRWEDSGFHKDVSGGYLGIISLPRAGFCFCVAFCFFQTTSHRNVMLALGQGRVEYITAT